VACSSTLFYLTAVLNYLKIVPFSLLRYSNFRITFDSTIFFSGEGPRSRRYGRTAALRLIVQPYDEDEDDYFLSFS
jgi:hypothetical protein